MRIVSKRRDYYDCIQASGQDRSLLYVRDEEEVELSGFPFPRCSENGTLTLRTHIIGFCGKIYPCLGVSYWQNSEQGHIEAKCFKLEDVDRFVEKHFDEKQVEIYRGGSKRYRFAYHRMTNSRTWLKHFFDDCAKKQNDFGKYFQEKRCPVFVANYHDYNNCQIVYNALLRPYEFYRVFDPPTAFQEISMFLGNMAQPGRPMKQLTNDEMIESKGFDLKFSFRKNPTKKKK
jgi:hypothetical protein